MKTKLCKKCGWQYNPELTECPVCGDLRQIKHCRACGKEYENAPRKVLCKECSKQTKRIYNNEWRRNKKAMTVETGETKKSESIKKALDEIKVSDVMFQTDRCNQDCDNCKYDDCILPEEG